MVRDERQRASPLTDHVPYMVCQYFPKYGQPRSKRPPRFRNGIMMPARRAGGHRDVDAPIHATERDDGSWVLCDVEAARQKGFWTLKCHGVAASTMHQPGDSVLYGHATNNRVVFTCLGRSRISHHGIPWTVRTWWYQM